MEQNKDFTASFTDAVIYSTETYSMIERGERILVAFSGGMDSAVLLSVLCDLFAQNGTGIGAFHLNHGIRGEEAIYDEKHCRNFCAERGIPFGSATVDVPSYAAKYGIGTEEAARKLRYEYLTGYCVSHHYDCVATAHHADDNLETVIFRLTRGTGIRGLCGIPPVRHEQGIRVIRPLIGCTRSDIERYAEICGISYVTDSTNDDERYSRNRIRKFVIPELKKINPAVVSAVTRLSEQLFDNYHTFHMIGKLPDEAFGEAGVPENVRRDRLIEAYGEAVQKIGREGMLEAVHVETLSGLEKSGSLWSKASLPGGITAVKTHKGIEFRTDTELYNHRKKNEFYVKNEKKAIHPGWNPIPGLEGDEYTLGAFYLRLPSESEGETIFCKGIEKKIKKGSINIYKLSIHISVNSDKLKKVIYVRRRLDGDRIICGGMTRRLKKLYQQKKISPEERENLPVVCDDEGILWVPGVALCDGLGIKESDGDGKRAELFYFSPESCKLINFKKTDEEMG